VGAGFAASATVTSRVGQYRILGTLGEGGMGTVFHGEHVLLGRRAAIKTLRRELATRREVADRFFHEARATSAIADPGVVQIYDFGFHVDGTGYIVMELLDGESLADRIVRVGRLPVDEALKILRQVATSVGVAHACGIVHRDLKPEHVILIRDPEAEGGERTKILDFGICKHLRDDGAPITGDGELLGTPVFISPEQCRGAADVDRRADIYALGCVLFAMLTGHPPFVRASSVEYVAAHLRETPPAPSTIVPEIPPVVDALVARCLAKSRDDRFPSALALTDAIADAMRSLAVAPAPVAIDVLDAWAAEPSPARTPAPAPIALSFTPKPTTLRSTSGEVPVVDEPRSRFGIGLASILIVAAIAGFAVLAIAPSNTDDAPVVTPSPREAPAAAAPESPQAPPPPAPVAPPPPSPSPTPTPTTPPPPPPIVVDEPSPPPRTIERPRRTGRKVRRATVARLPHPPAAAPPPPPPTSVEDLYETR
jgi:serine/threonine-protein kinase